MSEWVGELSRALADEFGDRPHICTLATVDKTGAPRARSVVCRKIAADGSVWVASDGRSEKNDQAKAVPQSEVVFWLPNRREQFRLLGSVKIVATNNDPSRLEVWKALSDASRATFFWPSPGARRIDAPEAFKEGVDANTAPPLNFELLVVRPRRVEQLQLAQHPHRRRRWMLAGNWSAAAEVNP
jgi:PPOX class probable FMN-dependent enzyme